MNGIDIESFHRKPLRCDRLADTLDYVKLYRCVKREMEQKSHLLEHVAGRIREAVQREFPGVRSGRLKIAKLNPPAGGKMQQVSCQIAWP